MGIDEQSEELFGRYQAMRTYATIARLPKGEFTSGQVCSLTDVPGPAMSKELRRLSSLGVIRPVSRRGEYERDDSSSFWRLVDTLACEWGYT